MFKKILFILILPFFLYAQWTDPRPKSIQLWHLNTSFFDSLGNVVRDSISGLSSDSVTIIYDDGFKQGVFKDTTVIDAIKGDSVGMTIELKQLSSGNTYGGGRFVYQTASNTVDGVSVFKAQTGYWVREEYLRNKVIYLTSAGAIPGDSVANQAAIAVLRDIIRDGDIIEVPVGDFPIKVTSSSDSLLKIRKEGVTLRGQSKYKSILRYSEDCITNSRAIVFLDSANGFVMENLTLDGRDDVLTDPSSDSYQTGVAPIMGGGHSGHDITIQHCIFKNFNNIGVNLNGSEGDPFSNRSRILDCTFTGGARIAATIKDGEISGNLIVGSDEVAGIEVFNCVNTNVTNNVIRDQTVYGIALINSGFAWISDGHSNIITNNIIRNITTNEGIYVHNNNKTIVSLNSIDTVAQNAIHILGSDECIVTLNTIANITAAYSSVRLDTSDGCFVAQNRSLTSEPYFIRLAGSSNNVVTQNYSAGGTVGIWLTDIGTDYSTNNRIYNNFLNFANHSEAITFASSNQTGNVVWGNDLDDSGGSKPINLNGAPITALYNLNYNTENWGRASLSNGDSVHHDLGGPASADGLTPTSVIATTENKFFNVSVDSFDTEWIWFGIADTSGVPLTITTVWVNWFAVKR